MIFHDQNGQVVGSHDDNAIPIQKGRTTLATLTREVAIPKGVSEISVAVPIVAQGDDRPQGGPRIRYPVAP